MAKDTTEDTDQTVVFLGNRNAIEILEDPDHPGDPAKALRTRIQGPKKNCTVITPPPGLKLLELATQITDPARGVWQAHSDDEAPAWVAVSGPYADALSQLLAAHYGGIEIRDPEPEQTWGQGTANAEKAEA